MTSTATTPTIAIVVVPPWMHLAHVSAHVTRQMSGTDMRTGMTDEHECDFPECNRPVHAKRYCRRHYDSLRKYGDPAAAKRVNGLQSEFIANLPETDNCIEWPEGWQRDSGGYPQVWHDGQTRQATHVVLEAAGFPRPESDSVARHNCDNPPCLNPRHLLWGTQADNVQDMIDRARGWWQNVG